MPPRVQKVVDAHKSPSPSPTSNSPDKLSGHKPTFTYSAHANKVPDHNSNFKANNGSSNQVFISGYTGFVPRLRGYFGEASIYLFFAFS